MEEEDFCIDGKVCCEKTHPVCSLRASEG